MPQSIPAIGSLQEAGDGKPVATRPEKDHYRPAGNESHSTRKCRRRRATTHGRIGRCIRLIVHNAAPRALRLVLLAQPVEFAGDCLRIRIELIRSDCGEFVQLIEAGWPRDDFEPFAAGFINQHRVSGIMACDQGQLFRSPVETWRKPGHPRKEVHCRNDFCRIACRVERDLWAAAGSDLEVRSVMIDARRDGQAVAAPLHLKGFPGGLLLGTLLSAKAIWLCARGLCEAFPVALFVLHPTHGRPALQWGMKVKVPKPSSPDPRVSEIQQWTKSFGSSVANAYVVNADALRELVPNVV